MILSLRYDWTSVFQVRMLTSVCSLSPNTETIRGIDIYVCQILPKG